MEKRAEKEGFEPSRRFPDLHPQQGRLFGLLSISPNSQFPYDWSCDISVLRRIDHYTRSTRPCQPIFDDILRLFAISPFRGRMRGPNIRISLKIESISIMIYRSYYHIVTKKTDSMPHGGKGYCDE